MLNRLLLTRYTTVSQRSRRKYSVEADNKRSDDHSLTRFKPKEMSVVLKPKHLELVCLQKQKGAEGENRFLPKVFHYNFTWLRHNCNSPKNLDPDTSERILDPIDIKQDIKPHHVEPRKKGLSILWNDNHDSFYTWDWLATHYGGLIDDPMLHPDLDTVTHKYGEGSHDNYKDFVSESLRKNGIAVVKNRGLDTEKIIRDFVQGEDKITAHVKGVEEMLFTAGSKKSSNTVDAGVTNAHTLLPFNDNPPRYRLIHCVTKPQSGGEEKFSDAQKIVSYLKEHDPITLNTLSSTNITFHKKNDKGGETVVAPILSLTQSGDLKQIRYSYNNMEPLRQPLAVVEAWYDAYIKFTKLVRDRSNQYLVHLNNGDFVLYDNYRMLHGREPFEGNRHVRLVNMQPFKHM